MAIVMTGEKKKSGGWKTYCRGGGRTIPNFKRQKKKSLKRGVPSEKKEKKTSKSRAETARGEPEIKIKGKRRGWFQRGDGALTGIR